MFLGKRVKMKAEFYLIQKGEKLKHYIYQILGLCDEDFYFSYLFKCFCNGKFDDFSLQSCLPFFWNELKLIQPAFYFV